MTLLSQLASRLMLPIRAAELRKPLPPKTHHQAIKTLSEVDFVKGQTYRNQQTRTSWQGAHPDILRFQQRYVKLALSYKIPIFAHEFMRSMDRQKELFARGMTKAKPGQSAHNYGMAVDMIHGVRAWELTDHEWVMLGQIGHEAARMANVKVQWGGEWNFYDPAHWELKNWRKLI